MRAAGIAGSPLTAHQPRYIPTATHESRRRHRPRRTFANQRPAAFRNIKSATFAPPVRRRRPASAVVRVARADRSQKKTANVAHMPRPRPPDTRRGCDRLYPMRSHTRIARLPVRHVQQRYRLHASLPSLGRQHDCLCPRQDGRLGVQKGLPSERSARPSPASVRLRLALRR
jgi:hypothetical protein